MQSAGSEPTNEPLRDSDDRRTATFRQSCCSLWSAGSSGLVDRIVLVDPVRKNEDQVQILILNFQYKVV